MLLYSTSPVARQLLPQVQESSLKAVQRRIAAAIQVGAPLYNRGDIAGCEAVYAALYRELLADPQVQADTRVAPVLSQQLAGLRLGATDSNAWQLRHGFDAVLAMAEPGPSATPATAAPAPGPLAAGGTLPLLDLADRATAAALLSVNDGVMGGVSSGGISYSVADQCVVFSGTVRTEFNGGFSSFRLQSRYPDLRRYHGLYVDCWARTPNKVWGLCVKDAAGYQAQMYFQVDFQAPEGAFGRVLVPFDRFIMPQRFGQPVNRQPMDWAALTEIGIIILKPNVGDFALLVKEIGAYR